MARLVSHLLRHSVVPLWGRGGEALVSQSCVPSGRPEKDRMSEMPNNPASTSPLLTAVEGERGPAVVLAHGMKNPAISSLEERLGVGYFTGVLNYLKAHNCRVLQPQMSPMGHVEERAQQLLTQIQEWDEIDEGEKVVVIGHSMGGLDARYMISCLGGAKLVHSLCTVCTPHRGSAFADLMCDKFAWETVAAHASKVGLPALYSIECLTKRFTTEFNEKCLDDPNVKYFSVSATKGTSVDEYWLPLRVTFPVMLREEGPNDGIVSVESAKWGTHLGTFALDHMEQVNHPSRVSDNTPWQMWDAITEHVLLPSLENDQSLVGDSIASSCASDVDVDVDSSPPSVSAVLSTSIATAKVASIVVVAAAAASATAATATGEAVVVAATATEEAISAVAASATSTSTTSEATSEVTSRSSRSTSPSTTPTSPTITPTSNTASSSSSARAATLAACLSTDGRIS